MNKNKKLLEEFNEYAKQHPGQRFWQALRNWSGLKYILKADALYEFGAIEGSEDTFHWENKNN